MFSGVIESWSWKETNHNFVQYKLHVHKSLSFTFSYFISLPQIFLMQKTQKQTPSHNYGGGIPSPTKKYDARISQITPQKTSDEGVIDTYIYIYYVYVYIDSKRNWFSQRLYLHICINTMYDIVCTCLCVCANIQHRSANKPLSLYIYMYIYIYVFTGIQWERDMHT